MPKDANDANNMHNSYTGRVTTASIINHRLPRCSVCISLMRTTLTPEQLTSKLCFGLVKYSVHDSKSVHFHTKFLMRTTVC